MGDDEGLLREVLRDGRVELPELDGAVARARREKTLVEGREVEAGDRLRVRFDERWGVQEAPGVCEPPDKDLPVDVGLLRISS